MSENAILFVHALTGLHPGSGAALGVVDLPVQRERHTHWPVIPASALKGVLRDACREKAKDKAEHGGSRKTANEKDSGIVAIFGPAKVTADSDSHAGALALTDARLLAYPVRSLKGVFAWVTCRAVLERLKRDLDLAGMAAPKLPAEPLSGKALSVDGSPLHVKAAKEAIVLEEFDFERVGDAKEVANWIADHALRDEGTRERVRKNLVILNDTDFTHFAEHASEVVARVGLDYEKKTVKDGALFYEEFLPPETLFYSLALMNDSRGKGDLVGAADLLKGLRAALPPHLQIGGDETIGRGICAVKLVGKDGKEVAA